MTSVSARLSRLSIAIAAAAILLPAAPAVAGGYLKLGDIKGESQDKGHDGQIEILSWSWGETQRPRKGNVEYSWKVEKGEKAAKGDMTVKGSKVDENAPRGDPDRPLIVGRVPNAAVEREMKESGEKGGTEDINIGVGVGELQEMTVSKSMDKSSPKLMQATAKGTHLDRPLPRGSLRIKAKMPWLACKVGTRYPTLEVGDGAKRYVLHDVMVASCGGDADDRPTEEVAFYYNKIE